MLKTCPTCNVSKPKVKEDRAPQNTYKPPEDERQRMDRLHNTDEDYEIIDAAYKLPRVMQR